MADTTAAERDPPPPYSRNDAQDPVSAHAINSEPAVPSSNDRLRPISTNIPAAVRRSMEDEIRELPEGWVRQLDSKTQHQFFVDTKADPPRSIWHHPYDDDQYLATVSSEERERIQALKQEGAERRWEMESTDDEESPIDKKHKTDGKGSKANTAAAAGTSAGAAAAAATAGPSSEAGPSSRPHVQRQSTGSKTFGRSLKDKLTGTTHDERVKRRAERAEEERRAMEAHAALRSAMSRAIETGQPQKFARDAQGHDIWVEPPGAAYAQPVPGYGPGYSSAGYPGGYNRYGYGQQYSAPYGGYGRGAFGAQPGAPQMSSGGSANPNAQRFGGPYSDPNARFIRPAYPYQRPYGGGYGGGLGLPIAGGLLGGALLGGLLF